MDNIYVIALTISVVYIISKFFEIRFILKENVNLKQLTIDTILVYFSVILGTFIIEQFLDKTKNLTQAPVFIDAPKF
ncbi:hypothetical protein ceV_121 [Chrysochromulina ericina virus CeV-01B]|jgi:hypothetical protein|uniref:Uncharacterized protein n=1 Tax=Chrysochromulina ericina virus CeV-01B TaxID=3070830 RepID=A0A0N9QWZ7_9VIRU|nr:hypothetical protein ceV_121 [Chrysochromulina ericina virus]ALH23027.1 hypothetical protein ceV_121 [Chrysochromulina ericina virus CeV-01B]|tara:strand:+ start:552 stop:782 length:231 start_codon:yes stop_codon:yes gene_type:complete